MTSIGNLGPVIPELFLAGVGLALLMIGVFRKGDATPLVGWLAVGALGVATILVAFGGAETQTAFGGLFIGDGFSRFAKVMCVGASALTLVMTLSWQKQEEVQRFELAILMVFATVGMMMMISANDLMSLYIGLEMQSLAAYVMASFKRDSLKSTEAGLKYFVLGSVASGMLLYGSSLVYGFTGTTNFTKLAEVLGHDAHTGAIVGLVFVMCGMAFKISAAPFHMWTPDVYEGAPTPITGFFAIAPKIAALALFLRLVTGPFMGLEDAWQQIAVVIAALSMIVGAFGAIVQTNIKRLMAYSSIGHMGYALIGLAVATPEGVRGVLIYLALYLFMNIGAFAVILSMRQKGRAVEGIADLAGMWKSNMGMAVALTIFMFSMAGIPPMAGFFGKFYVFMAAVDAGFYKLAILGVLSSVVGAFYYLRIVKVMFFDEPLEAFDAPVLSNRLILWGTSGVTALYIIWPSPLLSSAQAAAAALIGG